MRITYSARTRLLASTLLAGAVTMGAAATIVAVPGQALAQTSPAAPDQAAAKSDGSTQVKEVVVTGSILRRKNLETDAPLTIETKVELDNRGITTVQDAIQELSGNNSGALPNNFGGAFAHAASGASLRGLSTDSTLVLVDGLRAAYYPLSDDGQRNFVDLNTIPDFILDRVEVLQDGASSTYGADAVAGVINIITKKNFQGFEGKAEGGFAEHGGAGHTLISALVGKGDLNTDGWNFYLGGEYQKDEALYNSQRGQLYNTADQSYYCGTDSTGNKVCRSNGIINGLQFDNTYRSMSNTGTTVPVFRAIDPVTGAPITTGPDQDFTLFPGTGCGNLKSVTVTPSQATNPKTGATLSGFTGGPVTLCQQDRTKQYGVISPERSRYSLDGRFTTKLWEGAEGYFEGNFYEETVDSSGTPNSVRAKSPPGPSGTQISGSTSLLFQLPVWVCSSGVNCATDPNKKLNPNNPFAADGYDSQIFYAFGDTPVRNHEVDDVLRVAGGLHGVWGDGWNYSLDAVAMTDNMTWTRTGYISTLGLEQAIATGAYNFANPSLNTAAVRNLVSPDNTLHASTYETEVQANVTKSLWELPGGPVQIGFGGAYRSEGLNDPTANPETAFGYTSYFTINPFAASGSRTVKSGFYELDLPVLKMLDVDTSGRYDSYSTGASNFSPKVGVKFKPVHQLMLRATYSTGFRIPSFAETGAAPTTGYLNYTANACTAAQITAGTCFFSQHNNDGYGNIYSVGTVTIANPNLRPETSTNLTVGAVFEPTHYLAFTLDYFRIEKKNVVVGASCYGPALSNYYNAINAGQAPVMTTGACGIRVGDPDPAYPNAPPTASYVTVPNVNADSQLVDGIDFSVTGRFGLFGYGRLTSSLNGTYLNTFDQTDAGSVWHFAGTQGPNGPTAGSGSPRWRWNWINTFDFGKFGLTASVYYTSGMNAAAIDNGNTGCPGNPTAGDTYSYGVWGSSATPSSTAIVCHVSSFTDVDLHARYDLTSHWQVYADIQNLFDADAPFDPSSYAGTNYQPAWGSQGILGRYFKLGVKAKF